MKAEIIGRIAWPPEKNPRTPKPDEQVQEQPVEQPRVAVYIDWPNLFYSIAYAQLKLRVGNIAHSILRVVESRRAQLGLTWLDELDKGRFMLATELVAKEIFYDEDSQTGMHGPKIFEDVQLKYLAQFEQMPEWKMHPVRLKSDAYESRSRSRTDVAIASRVVHQLHTLDPHVVVLFTGDADFIEVAEIALEMGKKVVFVSLRNATSHLLLENHAYVWVPLDRAYLADCVSDAPPGFYPITVTESTS